MVSDTNGKIWQWEVSTGKLVREFTGHTEGVAHLTFSADVTYTHLDQKFSGTAIAPTVASVAKPATTYELKDQDTVSLLLRAQRNWGS